MATGGPDGQGGPHVFVRDVHVPVVAAEDHHHLAKSLRLRDGDPLTVSDGQGKWRECLFGEQVEPTGEVIVATPSPYPVAVGFALIKGGRPELVVQKLTELGVDTIVAFEARHSVVRWNEAKRTANVERWRKVAREASMQCRRVFLPDVQPVADLGELLAAGAVLADRDGQHPLAEARFVLIGPEGGWHVDERNGAPAVHLGDQVLRAETAAITAGVLTTAIRSGIVSAS